MADRFGEDVCVVYQKVFRTESGEKVVSDVYRKVERD